jgi:hypothetical protein
MVGVRPVVLAGLLRTRACSSGGRHALPQLEVEVEDGGTKLSEVRLMERIEFTVSCQAPKMSRTATSKPGNSEPPRMMSRSSNFRDG